MAELKTYSVLIAWDDDDEKGEYGDTVRARDSEEAEVKVRESMRNCHIENHCGSDDTADEIAESCAEYETTDLYGNVIFGGRVLDCHEGAIWKAADLEKRLRDLIAVELYFGDHPQRQAAFNAARELIASIDAI